ncbi:cysteine proteinase [Aspergillus campestris IBT 28561]|uniref:Cysteine proteinase n=1 Tax=Aspergillus campestris (strain IBT 28561) TaxID=1392248 RepID=A0A2I1D1W1_ASPC2|nr:cysteine proteinase [Aspergillus campestris IBT 28561]PKY03860.1 cysteine proteinase [Aspergillus campestris IBT 28561]
MVQAVPDTSSVAGNSARLSTTSSQLSAKPKKSREMNEFRDVERGVKVRRPSHNSPRHGGPRETVWSPDEERFTENATKERRSGLPRTQHLPKRDILQSVEIAEGHVPTANPAGPVPSPTRAGSGRSRESSDELQGAATVSQARAFGALRGRDSKLSQAASVSRSSPSDIIPTVFIGEGKSKKKNKSKKRDELPVFETLRVQLGSSELLPAEGESVPLRLDGKSGKIILLGKSGPKHSETLIQRITKVIQGGGSSRKAQVHFPATQTLDGKADIEFISPEARRGFCEGLEKREIRVVVKDSDWMDKAFRTHKRQLASHERPTNGSKRARSESSPEPEARPEGPRRAKLSDRLQDERGNTAGQKPNSDTARGRASRKLSPSSKRHGTRRSPSTDDHGVDIPVIKYTPQSSTRSTRSMARRMPPTTIVCDDGDDDYHLTPKSDVKHKKWHRPLVYPRFGKKKAEVDAQDLERLRAYEFLNDNLIGFYIRFLEDHLDRCNKEVAKRVYFFNSYFFATLTNAPGRKRGINYEGVEKWTRNVDLFGYDYVVVPINENAHWYLTIICNLPSLKSSMGEVDTKSEPDSKVSPAGGKDVQEIPETQDTEGTSSKDQNSSQVVDSESSQEESARESFASMNLDSDSKPKDVASEEWPEDEENPSLTRTSFSSPADRQTPQDDPKQGSKTARQSRKKKNPRPSSAKSSSKNSTQRPCIITFDSLDMSRPSTVRFLKDYLSQEAQSKKGVEINTSLIKGMKAGHRHIPLQPNFSDCGLYLLAYLEKFVQDPDSFVKKLLANEMRVKEDWPPLRSGLLRTRLRGFLDRLYDEQMQLSRETAGEKITMADKQPVDYLLGVPEFSKQEESATPRQSSPESEPESDGVKKRDKKDGADSPAPEKQPTEPKDTKQAAATTRQPSRSPNPQPQPTDPRQPAQHEIVEVPDSQEPIHAPHPTPPRVVIKRPGKPADTVTDDHDAISIVERPKTVADTDTHAQRATTPEAAPTRQTLEVQVPGTPPKKSSSPSRERVRRSPH